MSANNDATLEEIRNQLAKKTGILIGCSAVDRMLKMIFAIGLPIVATVPH